MKHFFDKIFFRSNNLDHVAQKIKNLTKNTPAIQIFKAINSYSSQSEVRYVGGCVRKIINNEKVDDIDLATNLEPKEVCEALKKNNIKYYETGIDHGTITVLINEYKFEITSLREDISTDGRHATVKFSKNWKDDASRRDFTINSIYSDADGNLFDPYNGKKDLENGLINFIGDANRRIQEDYLRILRYIRFFLNYSKHAHNPEILKKIKINLTGISQLSKERMLDELKKIAKLKALEKLSKDKLSLEIMTVIFPECKNLNFLVRLDRVKKEILYKSDFTFLIALMTIDETDNVDYFLYKFNISNKDKKRIKIIDNFFKEKLNLKSFTENKMNEIFYYHGKDAVIDILNFKLIKSKKFDKNLLEKIELYRNKKIPIMPIGADILMTKYKIPEGRQLGVKLKLIESEWVKNNFQLSDHQVDSIIKS